MSPVPVDADSGAIAQQEQNEEAWRQLLVQGVLAVILPTDDLENGCLRALVAEIISEIIIWGALSSRACEGWMLWDTITNIIERLAPKRLEDDVETGHAGENTVVGRLEQFGLLTSLKNGETADSRPSRKITSESSALPLSSISAWFWLGVQYIFLASTAVRATILAVVSSTSLPSRPKTQPVLSSSPTTESSRQANSIAKPKPLVSMSLWRTVGHLMELDVRMPWLSGVLSLLHWLLVSGAGRVGVSGAVDRLVTPLLVFQCYCNKALSISDWAHGYGLVRPRGG